jgi:uncharacterized protein involved in exopolysaccharide biosynthesis
MIDSNTNIQHNRQCLEEDEIDLRELASTIWKYRLKIAIFTAVITMLTILYTLSLPNEYESKALLIPQEQGKMSAGGGLTTLAGLAGVELGSGDAPKPEDSYKALLENYTFMRSFIIKNGIHKRLLASNSDANYRFALGFSGIYALKNVFKSDAPSFDTMSKDQQEEALFELFDKLSRTIKIEADKKTSILTLSVKHPDAVFARDLVVMFLKDASAYLRQNEMLDNENKIKYYDEALARTNDVTLKTKLAELESALIQKKVLAQANELYNVKLLTAPEVAYEKDKAGPKRGLIVIVSFVTSMILAIFGVFFLEFLKKDGDDQ